MGTGGITQFELDRLRRYTAELESTLRLSEERELHYRALVDQCHEGVWAIAAAGHTTFVNSRMAELLRCRPEDLLGHPAANFLFEEDRHGALDLLQLERASYGSIYNFRLRRGDGQAIWTNLSVTPLNDANGVSTGILALVSDVTDRKLSEQALLDSEARFRGVFDRGPLGMALVTADGRLLQVNERFCHMLGYTPSELLRLSFADITHPEDRALGPELTPQLYAREVETCQVEKRYVTRSGTPIWACVTATLVWATDGKPFYGITVIENITNRKREQAELHQAHLDLNAAAEDLRRSNKDLEQFALTASHDLQEPLRTISAFSHLLSEKFAPALDERAREMLAYIHSSTVRMRALVRDLLQYSRIAQDTQPPRSNVPVEDLLRHSLLNLKQLIQEQDAEITHDSLPALRVMESQFVQLLQNLVGNSLKYSRSGVAPRIHISAVPQADNTWLFSIRDNGVGFDPAHARTIFLPFRRLHPEDNRGTGIGLALCQRIVERHGGRIWAESLPGAGSTFYFTIAAG